MDWSLLTSAATVERSAPVSTFRPAHSLARGALSLPEVDAVVMHPRDESYSFGVRVESRVSKKAPYTPYKMGGIVRSHIQKNQTVGRMTGRGVEEILVLREKSHPALPLQQGNDLRVLHARKSALAANLPEGDMPRLQQWPLVLRKVFVQQIQAASSSETFRGARLAGRPYRSSNACLASRTASATPARGIRPPQRVLQMNSHDRPSATSSNTC